MFHLFFIMTRLDIATRVGLQESQPKMLEAFWSSIFLSLILEKETKFSSR